MLLYDRRKTQKYYYKKQKGLNFMTLNLTKSTQTCQTKSEKDCISGKKVFINYGFLEYIDYIKDINSLSSTEKKIFHTMFYLIFKTMASGTSCVLSQRQIGMETRKRFNLKENTVARETVNRAINLFKQKFPSLRVESTGTWRMFCSRRKEEVTAKLPMKYGLDKEFINGLKILALQDSFWGKIYNMYLHSLGTPKEFDNIKYLKEIGITITKAILRFKNCVLRIASVILYDQLGKREIRNVDGYFYRICLNVEANIYG